MIFVHYNASKTRAPVERDARSTGARRALRWSAHLEAVLLSLCWSAHPGAVHLVCLLGLLVLLLLLLPLLTHSLCQNHLCYFMAEPYLTVYYYYYYYYYYSLIMVGITRSKVIFEGFLKAFQRPF